MIKKVKETIYSHNLIEENDHILLGLSGGKDSVFTLYILLELQKSIDFKISIGHFNHEVRGELANRDENFCKELAKSLNLDFYTDSYNMEKYGKDHSISDEEAGRILRSNFFRSTMENIKANKLATGHNSDDQVETVLMRIIRGTGLDGLEGIEYKRDYIIRPILDISRSEIDSYIEDNNIKFVDDHTNYENIYHRNKIRNLLIPELENQYNPEVKRAILNLSKLATEDKNFLNKISLKEFKNSVISKVEDSIVFNRNYLKKLDKAIISRVLRLSFEHLHGHVSDISYDNIESIINLLDLETGKMIDNIGGYKICNSYDKVIFEPYNRKNYEEEFLKDLQMGINYIYDDLSIELESVKSIEDDEALYIPNSIISGSLQIRNRRPGDRIRLPGLGGSKKIKDLFIDEKIPRENRNNYLMIVDNSKIYSILGLRRSEIPKIKDDEYIKVKIIGGKYAQRY